MSTATGNYAADNSTLANFKGWCQAISNAFAAFGWVQTADTGQVNWGAIASVPSSAFVYEVWKTNDALSSTFQMFVKVEYGYSSTLLRMRITVGTSSNGSGTITGQATAAFNVMYAASGISNQGSTTIPCYFSGDSGSFRMILFSTNTLQIAVGMVLERSLDTSGNPTGTYYNVLTWCSTTSASGNQQSIFPTGLGPYDTAPLILVPSTTTGFYASTGTVAAFPCFPNVGKFGNPFLGLMMACPGDVGINNTVTVTAIYGSTHTYIATFNTSMSQAAGSRYLGSNGYIALLTRYE